MIIAEIAKNKREHLRIELAEFKGHHLLGLRVWAQPAEGEAIATRKGVTLAVALLPDILAALKKAEAEAISQGWLNG
ncbi:MAG: transcriptional regulator [Alphaproteobacteria bacterium]|nr:transcriptional regulator [Alphaproteobacteria bacterium]